MSMVLVMRLIQAGRAGNRRDVMLRAS